MYIVTAGSVLGQHSSKLMTEHFYLYRNHSRYEIIPSFPQKSQTATLKAWFQIGILSLKLLSWLSWRFPTQYRLLPLLLVAYQNLIIRPCCWRYSFCQSTWRKQVSTDQKAFSLLDSFQSTGRCYVVWWGVGVTSGLIQLWTTVMSGIIRYTWVP